MQLITLLMHVNLFAFSSFIGTDKGSAITVLSAAYFRRF
ncbi:hypothetical protein SAMN05444682_101336 [Parapedobacter indicus]|uniref:Uncharacterized protein n=1 Tax=Parapedobacter indicus TaxID=1477437 RepID=A0A1I3D6H0_9SPHI|nr:hypothetical protein CLV26_101349 [Parapedobacter indicus]SFH82330.1 hypothetical protein SAMN05444682_101336 [Parapedobacter indicus]